MRSIRGLELKKPPSVSETIDWARTLLLLGVEQVDAATATGTANILLKYQSDIAKATRELEQDTSLGGETAATGAKPWRKWLTTPRPPTRGRRAPRPTRPDRRRTGPARRAATRRSPPAATARPRAGPTAPGATANGGDGHGRTGRRRPPPAGRRHARRPAGVEAASTLLAAIGSGIALTELLSGFIVELRSAGLPVSLTENLDAMAADPPHPPRGPRAPSSTRSAPRW